MVCYGPRITTVALVGVFVYAFFHRTIIRILHIAGTIFEVTLISCAAAAATVLLIWTIRTIQRRRAMAGGCTGCRFRCQQPLTLRSRVLTARPHTAGVRALPPQPLTVPTRALAQTPRVPAPAQAVPSQAPRVPAPALAAPPQSPAAPHHRRAAPARPAVHLGMPTVRVVSHDGFLLTADGVTSARPTVGAAVPPGS